MTMPRLLIASFLLATLATGCGDALAFDLNAEVDEFTVPGDPQLHHSRVPLEAGIVPSIELQLDAVQPDSVSLAGLRFYVTDSSRLDDRDEDGLEFIDSIDVYIVPNDRGTGLPDLRVASWTGPAPEGATELHLEIQSDQDLTPYIKAGFTLEPVTTGVVPYDDVSVRGAATFRVNPF